MSKLKIRLFGLACVLHDIRDVGKFDRLHHWMLGFSMVLWPRLFLSADKGEKWAKNEPEQI